MTDAAAFAQTADLQDAARDARSLSPASKTFAAIFLYVALWAGAVAMWGLPGLYLPAVAKVPLIFVMLGVITRG